MGAESILKKLSLVQDAPLHQTTLQNTTNSGRSLILCTRTKLAATACILIGQTDQPYKRRQEQEPLMMMMICMPELQSQGRQQWEKWLTPLVGLLPLKPL